MKQPPVCQSRDRKMWHSVTMLAALLAAVAGQSKILINKKEGDVVVLKPGAVTTPITSIVWKVGVNLASEWEASDKEVTYYRHFKVRGSLNISSGEMTIRGLIRNDSDLYTPEINDNRNGPRTLLTVISPVPEPAVTTSCDEEKAGCTLTCEGNTKGAEPVAYKWKWDDTELTNASKHHHVEKENSLNIKEFSCELENPVSRESSPPIPNPFIEAALTAPGGNLNINTGLVVFLSLLVPVLLLAFIHRGKSGVWFFQKDSMPWEADFWRKAGRPARDAAESNGTRAHLQNEENEEETALT